MRSNWHRCRSWCIRPPNARRARRPTHEGLPRRLTTVGRSIEVCGQDANGCDVEIEVTSRGQVLDIATAISSKEVPRVVLDALRAKARGMRFTSVESIQQKRRPHCVRDRGRKRRRR